MSNVNSYADDVLASHVHQLTEGEKVLVGLMMVADALTGIRQAIAPDNMGSNANIVEGMMASAEALGDKIVEAISHLGA